MKPEKSVFRIQEVNKPSCILSIYLVYPLKCSSGGSLPGPRLLCNSCPPRKEQLFLDEYKRVHAFGERRFGLLVNHNGDSLRDLEVFGEHITLRKKEVWNFQNIKFSISAHKGWHV